jgi:hypothetical protein
MPCLSFLYNAVSGPIIQVAILPPKPPTGGLSNLTLYAALLDTGASATCISADAVKDAGLLPIGKQGMVGVGGVSATNLYQFHVGIAQNQTIQPTGGTSVSFALFPVQGMEFVKTGGATFDVLIGRDILCKGHLSVSADGHGVFCW